MLKRLASLCLFMLIGLLGCDDAVAPVALSRATDTMIDARNATGGEGDVGTESMPIDVDIWNCWRYETEETWNCQIVGTSSYWIGDYWDRGEFYTSTYCRENRNKALYCNDAFKPGGGSGYTDPISTAPGEDSDTPSQSIPTCPAPFGADDPSKAYCAGAVPTTTQKDRIRTALSDMKKLGGICETLANIGFQLIARPTAIKVFPIADFGFGGGAPTGGGAFGDDSWLIVGDRYVDTFYGKTLAKVYDRGWGMQVMTNLQFILAHELDHLNGEHHSKDAQERESKMLTKNAQLCSGL